MAFWQRYWHMIRTHRLSLALSLCFIAVMQFLTMGPALVFKHLLDQAQLMAAGGDVGAKELVGTVLVWIVIEYVSDFVDAHSNRRNQLLQLEMMEDLRRTVYHKLVSLPMAYHSREHTGKKTSTVTHGTEAISDITMTLFYQFLPMVVKTVIAFVVLTYIWWPLTVIITPILVVSFAKAYKMRQRMKQAWKDIEDVSAECAALSDDLLSNISTVQAFGQGRRLIGEFGSLRDRLLAHERLQINLQLHRNHWRNRSLTAAYGVVFLLCAWRISEGLMSLGTLAFAYTIARDLAHQTVNLERSLMTFGRQQEQAERLFQMIDRPSELVAPVNPLPVDNLRGSITFEGVSFAYPGGEHTLRTVDVRIAAGTTVAVVGKSGAGKSTFIQLILRAYDPDAGRVLVDGKNLRDVDLDAYRAQIGYVRQGTDLFNQSIAWNIALGKPEAPREEIEAVARLAGIHEYIVSLPEGYDTVVGERGITLSGGQAQRLAIARALLPNPRILIFDEATSALDGETEAEIQAAIERIRAGRTVIVIAHRLSTIRLADQVVVLDSGRVVQDGSYHELAQATGPFQSMLARQFQLPVPAEA